MTLLLKGAGKQTPAVGAASYRTEVLADSPYRYWENWAATPVEDAVADAGDLTTVGATMNQTGPLTSGDTKAGTFDGTDDRGSAAMDLSDTNVVTIEFWLWWDAYANDDDAAFEFTSAWFSNAGGFVVSPNYSLGTFRVGHLGDVSYNLRTFTRPSAAAWHHYAVVLDKGAVAANEVTVYVDGSVEAGTLESSSNNTNNFANSTLHVMCRDQASLFGAGRMAHIAIYKSALSAGRVSAHWAAR